MSHLTLLDRANRPYRVDAPDAVVGRDPNATIVMEGEGVGVVSSRHARLFLADGHWWIEDIGSRNGTYVAGKRLTTGARHRLAIGDEIGFGASGPRLRVQEAVGRSLAATIAEPIAAVPLATVVEPAPAYPAGHVGATTAAAASSSAQPGKQQVRVVLRASDGKRLVGQDVEVVIGRSRESTVRLDGDMAMAVSRRHARVYFSGWKICIEDLGSRNGTWLNRKRVLAPTVLERADIIEFGAGGPRLTVEDVALMEGPRVTAVDMPAMDRPDAPFQSELPTPTDRPAFRTGNDK